MIDRMQGKISLVTGATNGIGKITAMALAKQGATVVIIGRNAQKTQETQEEIRRESGNAQIDYIVADLSSMAQVRTAAQTFRSKYKQLHVLVNNAGALFNERQVSADGYEMTFALNHLNYFLLTHELLDLLIASGSASQKARVVNVSSLAHTGGKIDFDDLNSSKRYRGFGAYAQSKLANILFSNELARRMQQANAHVTSNALHPGFVATGFGQGNSGILTFIFKIIRPFAISPEKGAETSIYLASSPEVEGVTGQYFADKKAAKPAAQATDLATAQRLWQVSEQMTQ